MTRANIEWQTLEHTYHEKTSDWYWVVGIAGGTLSILCFLFGNPTLGILLIAGTLSVLVHGAKKPNLVDISIGSNGVKIGNALYPYSNLASFSIDEEANPKVLVIDTKALLVPDFRIFLEDIDPELVRDYLLDHLDEKYSEPSLAEGLIHYLGF